MNRSFNDIIFMRSKNRKSNSFLFNSKKGKSQKNLKWEDDGEKMLSETQIPQKSDIFGRNQLFNPPNHPDFTQNKEKKSKINNPKPNLENKTNLTLDHSTKTDNHSKNSHTESQNKDHGALDESGVFCNICYAAEADSIFMRCGHGGVCLDCAKDVVRVQGECYLCRGSIDYVLRYDNQDKRDDQFKITELHQFE